MGKEVPRSKLTRMALEIVAAFRGMAKGLIERPPDMSDWTVEEFNGVADLILEDLRRDDPQVMEELQKVYQKTGGHPIKLVEKK